MEKSFEIGKAKIIVYPEKEIIHHIVTKPMSNKNFENLLMKGADLFAEYKCHKWLSEEKFRVAFDDNFAKWASSWESKVMKFGWKAWALVLDKNIDYNQRMEENNKRIRDMGVRVETFNDPESAMAWLEKQ